MARKKMDLSALHTGSAIPYYKSLGWQVHQRVIVSWPISRLTSRAADRPAIVRTVGSIRHESVRAHSLAIRGLFAGVLLCSDASFSIAELDVKDSTTRQQVRTARTWHCLTL